MNKRKKNLEKGITLIALVITIIILLILAGISIAMLTGENGILNKATQSKKDTEISSDKETLRLEYSEFVMQKLTSGNSSTFLEYLDGKGYVVDYDDDEKKTGTVILNGKIYAVSDNQGLEIEYKGEGSGTALLVPRITKLQTSVSTGEVKVDIELKDKNGVKLKYSIKKDGEQEDIEETEEIEDLTYTFKNLEQLTKYIVTIDATNEYGSTKKSTTITTGSPILVSKITLNETTKTIGTSETLQLNATIEPDNAEDKTVTWSTSDSSIATVSDAGLVTPVKVGNVTITCSSNDGGTSATCEVSVVIKPTEGSTADSSISFSTAYGKIDVIWLSGTGNTVTSSPNAPELFNNGLTPVSWTKNGDTWTEDTSASASYYSYTAGSGNEDNTSSRWANAKNTTAGGDSYFVWIPRYAYRITYYSSQSSTEPTGYYDGWGQWKASDGKVRLALDSGIETVEHGGNKYIVHPAFCGESVGYDNGSWSNAISGFWVAKYEMSRTGATSSSAGSGYNTTFLSVPNVQSARSITIGNMYNVAKSYDSSKESHLMKNSEWGAVAYLTQSQYGRNGNEIDINNSSSYITGNGGGSTSASSASGTTNAYNTTTGAKASTTGNVYGVYDMSGGAWEYVAVFNNKDTNNYESSYGSSFASRSGSSDKYATKYYNETSSTAGNARIYTYGKIGDATKEVNKGGAYALSNTSTYFNWFGDAPHLCSASYPFVLRGGYCNEGVKLGVFSSVGYNGDGNSERSLRTVLCP